MSSPVPVLEGSGRIDNGARIAGPVLVLVAWAALGTLLALALGSRIMDPVDTEAGPPREPRY